MSQSCVSKFIPSLVVVVVFLLLFLNPPNTYWGEELFLRVALLFSILIIHD